MLSKFVVSLLSCAVVIVSLSPTKVFAQIQNQANLVANQQHVSTAQVETKSDMKTIFAEKTAKIKSNALTKTDFKRFERERLFPRTTGQAKKKARTTTIIVVILAAVTVAVVVAVAKYGAGDVPPPSCNLAPDFVGCIP